MIVASGRRVMHNYIPWMIQPEYASLKVSFAFLSFFKFLNIKAKNENLISLLGEQQTLELHAFLTGFSIMHSGSMKKHMVRLCRLIS